MWLKVIDVINNDWYQRTDVWVEFQFKLVEEITSRTDASGRAFNAIFIDLNIGILQTK